MELQQRADKLTQLIEDRLGTRGRGLESKLARAGRQLPGFLRTELAYVVEALRMQANPRLQRQIDHARVDRAIEAAERHLRSVDPWDRRKGAVINWLAGNAFNLLIVGSGLVAFIVWRGLW